jgi:hypothetical protein
MISEYEDQLLLTVTQAARSAGVDRRTIRRRLDAGSFPRAHREPGSNGPGSGRWLIPAGDLVEAGLPLHDPAEPDADLTTARAEVEALRAELAETVRRAEVAEARAAERERVIAAQELALRALTPDDPDAEPDEASDATDPDGGDAGAAGSRALANPYRPVKGTAQNGHPDADTEEAAEATAGEHGARGTVPSPVSVEPDPEPRPAPTLPAGAPSKPTPPWVPIPQPPLRRRRWQRRP